MKTIHNRLLIPLFGLMATLLAACSGDVVTDDTQPLPEGTGNIRITICTPEANPSLTRAVNATPWEDPNNTWEWLHSYRILICNSKNLINNISVQNIWNKTGSYALNTVRLGNSA